VAVACVLFLEPAPHDIQSSCGSDATAEFLAMLHLTNIG
jgi:hypothetical protein